MGMAAATVRRSKSAALSESGEKLDSLYVARILADDSSTLGRFSCSSLAGGGGFEPTTLPVMNPISLFIRNPTERNDRMLHRVG